MLEPFVHTWSLAVEEQFYILFPPIVLLLTRHLPRLVAPAFVGGLVLGLVGAHLATLVVPSLSFFWLPSRVWELLAGACLAYAQIEAPGFARGGRLDRIAPAIGLALILVSFFVVGLPAWTHPGLPTLPAVLGAAMIIWFANPAEPVTRLLSSRPFVAVGLISYSLYLWHYPIFAFGRHLNLEPSLAEKAVWTLLSFAAATLSYHVVERPFRRPGVVGRGLALRGLVGSTAAVCLVAGLLITEKGFPQRFQSLAALYGENAFDNELLRDASWSVLDALDPDEDVGPWNAQAPSEHEAEALWFRQDRSTKVLIVGDSHAKDLFNALTLNSTLFPDHEFARFGFASELRPEQIARLVASPNFEAADVILFSFRYNRHTLAGLPAVVNRVQGLGKRVAIATNSVEFDDVGGLPLFDWYVRSQPASVSWEDLDRLGWRYRDRSVPVRNERVAQIAAETGAVLLDKESLICSAEERLCHLVTPDGRKAFFDYGHFTLEGAAYFGRRIREMEWLAPLGSASDGASSRRTASG